MHFIGQLQSNKVRQVAAVVDVWETVDRPRLVDEIARRAPGARVLVQVDATGEPGKGGCPLDDVPALVRAATAGRARGRRVDDRGPDGRRPGSRPRPRSAPCAGSSTSSASRRARWA